MCETSRRPIINTVTRPIVLCLLPQSLQKAESTTCTDIELSIALHMRSPVVDREGASAHTLRVAYFRPCISVRYQAVVQARRITILGTPCVERPIFHVVRTFLLYSID